MSFSRTLLFIACLLLLLIPDSKALVLRQYTTNEMLVSNTVYSAVRDSKGYMWFCTDKGLSRFDGNQFRNFSIADGMSDNEVFAVFEDHTGRIWLFTFNGQPCYYYKGKFHNISNDSMLRQFPVLPFINSMYEKDNILYFGYLSGYLTYLKDTKLYTINAHITIGSRHLALTEKDGYLVAVGKEESTYIRNNTIVKRSHKYIENCFQRNGQTFSLDRNGIMVEGPGALKFYYKDSDLVRNDVLNIYYDQNERIFVCTRMGLIITNKNTRQKDTLLPNISVTSVMQDQYGNYWITTLEHGIYCLDAGLFNARALYHSDLIKITRTPHNLFLQDGLSLHSIFPGKDGLQASTVNQMQHITDRPLYMDSTMLIYEQMYGNKLFVHDYRRNKTTVTGFNVGLRYLYLLGRDSFLDVDYNSFYKLHISADGVRVHEGMKGPLRIHRHYWSPRQHVYYAIADKLYRYTPANDSVRQLDRYDFSSAVEAIFSIGKWIIVSDNKKRLHIYDELQQEAKRVIACPYVIYSAQKMNSAEYLLQTDVGYVLARGDTSAGLSLSYNRVEYPFLYLDVHALYIEGDYLVCWVKDQVISLKKELLNKELYTPRLYIDDISINGTRYTGDSIRLINTTACNVAIQLNALTPYRDISYHYRIWQDNSWSNWYTTESPDLNLLLYKPGKYNIEFKVITRNQRVSLPVTLMIDLIPPFFRSTLFYILMGVVLLALLALLTVWIVQAFLRKKNKAFKEELQHLQLEHKAINALLNPHFIFNVVNNIQDLINNNSKESANNYLATMSKMIRQNIENLQFNLIPVANELDLIRNYIELQNLRFDNRIRLEIDYDPVATADIYLPPLMLHTFVENCIVHGFNKEQPLFHIHISIDLTINDYVHVQITDDGTGLKPKPAPQKTYPGKTSLGINFNRKRLQRISEFYKVGFNMELQQRSDGQRGTEVQMVFYARFARLIQADN